MSIQSPAMPDKAVVFEDRVTSVTIAPHSADRAASGWGDVLGSGFGITVAAWITAYISRMPLIQAPAQVTVSLMLAIVFLGGFFAARYSQRGLRTALLAGAVSGVLDILILGSILEDRDPNNLAPAAALWITGSILANALVAGAGGLFGALFPSTRRGTFAWTSILALVLTVATLPLITAGGLVTAFHAGLAVPDWPRSYGYNMFLFPLSMMQSARGNFYEHAHRLLGSLVGLTALTTALYVTFAEDRRWVKVFAWSIFAAVCIQGILGGTRVTEKSISLAITHGVFAQIVFAAMASLAAITSRRFRDCPPAATSSSAANEYRLTSILLILVIIQLTLGALVRHIDVMVMLHITMAAFVATLAVACGFRSVGLYHQQKPLRNTGIALMAILTLQLLLGIIALAVRAQSPTTTDPTPSRALLTTAHQANGALLLAICAVLATWARRLLSVPTNNLPCT